MKASRFLRIPLVLVSAAACFGTKIPAHDESCPSVKTVGSHAFNLTEWVRKTWFIQEQQVVDYQPLSSFYCVAATYNLEGKTVPFFRGTVATVYNYANHGEVNGPLVNAKNMTLCARAVNNEDASRLAVAPCFLPNILAGPYWVLAIGEDAEAGEYEWAVVIGGEPSVQWDDGCTTKEDGTNGAGLWLFTRNPVATKAQLGAMHAALKAQGIATSRLHPVEHHGCNYHGATLK
jgi:apolipoprotein D and lipocalin family protein